MMTKIQISHMSDFSLVSAPDPFIRRPMRMRRERGGAEKKGSGDTA